MREIKFRAFANGKMVEVGSIEFFIDGSYIINDEIPIRPEQLMETTGLKDKNEKDIYEGDIIETNYGKVGTVVYNERTASFIIHDPSHFNEQLWSDAHYSKIIGNVYEHLSLLSNEQKAQGCDASKADQGGDAGTKK